MFVMRMLVAVRMRTFFDVHMWFGIVPLLFFRRITGVRMRDRRNLSGDKSNEHESRNKAAKHQQSSGSVTFKVTP